MWILFTELPGFYQIILIAQESEKEHTTAVISVSFVFFSFCCCRGRTYCFNWWKFDVTSASLRCVFHANYGSILHRHYGWLTRRARRRHDQCAAFSPPLPRLPTCFELFSHFHPLLVLSILFFFQLFRPITTWQNKQSARHCLIRNGITSISYRKDPSSFWSGKKLSGLRIVLACCVLNVNVVKEEGKKGKREGLVFGGMPAHNDKRTTDGSSKKGREEKGTSICRAASYLWYEIYS